MRGRSWAAPLHILLFGAAAVLAGCQTAETVQAPLPVSKPPAYAMAGGDAGPRRLQAMREMGLAPIPGNEVGFYMDGAEAELLSALRRQGVSVTRVGNSLILNMQGELAFAPNSTGIAPKFAEALKKLAITLDAHDRILIDVTGHTDSSGNAEANRKLSEERARSVAELLIAQGVEGKRFILRGSGASEPIASNRTAEGRAQNRRVEIKLAPFTMADQRASYRRSVAP